MARFTPCQGKSACRDNGVSCLTCGRALEEIERLRVLLDQLASLAVEYDYDNVDEYAAYIAGKLNKAIQYRRQTESDRCPA
ncbi:MAG: hypothetical protein JAZ02_06080 [Candidatus Thiodiazotropha endolucinida]|nr:hypothetical protein [Candidatus Thiodiazotropha endolucinida]